MTIRDSYLEAIKIYKDLIAQQEDLIAIFPVNTFHMKEILKDLEELDKYKRAFEILKKHLNIELVYTDDGCEPTWFLDANCGREIEQEEYELLEELMKELGN